MPQKQDLKALFPDQLKQVVADFGEPSFRASQIEQWLWQKGACSFDEMTNLSKELRGKLKSSYRLDIPKLIEKQVSSDGTRKYLFELYDGITIETVGIPSSDERRLTVCFSTQAGCAMGCVFCATGRGGFVRNLSIGEMFDQVRLVGEDFERRVSNVVAMGQGEPFNNYDACLQALRTMNSNQGLNIGSRHITVSTCGITNQIDRFAQEPEQFTLAVSLHSAIQETRDQLMPGVRGYPLPQLKEAIKHYGDTTRRRPTFEYAAIAGYNDDDAHIDALVEFCHGLLCHVNLIPLNPIDKDSPNAYLEPSPRLNEIQNELSRQGIEVSIRNSRGKDIDGACGQLSQKHKHQLN